MMEELLVEKEVFDVDAITRGDAIMVFSEEEEYTALIRNCTETVLYLVRLSNLCDNGVWKNEIPIKKVREGKIKIAQLSSGESHRANHK